MFLIGRYAKHWDVSIACGIKLDKVNMLVPSTAVPNIYLLQVELL